MFVNADNMWEAFYDAEDGTSEIEVCGYLANKELEDQVSHCWDFPRQITDDLYTTDGELTPVVCGVAGRGDGGRANCSYEEPYGSIIWHTHPLNSKPYPSPEDIIKGLKPRDDPLEIKDNLLICRWGIWEWSAGNKQVWDSRKKNEYKEFIKEKGHELAEDAYSDVPENSLGKRRVDLNKTIHSSILEFIYDLDEYFTEFKFQIQFTSWNDARPYYYLNFGGGGGGAGYCSIQ
jgi:hypothetical protein|uniref:Uncharacterized protein n=1 Tax=viral metagenome TaxID=1070528 RepID=A0A6C0J3Y2_9ZZZZ